MRPDYKNRVPKSMVYGLAGSMMLKHKRFELNRFTEVFFGAFRRFFLACRQASGVISDKNPSKNSLCKVPCSFCELIFCSDKENREVDPCRINKRFDAV